MPLTRRKVVHPQSTRVIIGLFALLSLAPVLALGFVLAKVIDSGVQQQNLTQADRTAVLLAQIGIQPLLQPGDLAAPLTPTRLDQLDTSLQGASVGKIVSRIKIWSRDSIVVYSDNRALVGRSFPADSNLSRALAGTSASEISDAASSDNAGDNLTGRFLSVYVPLYFPDAPHTPRGAFEIYLPWGPVAAQIESESRFLYLLLGAGLGLLYLSMIPLLVVADRWRRRLADSLESVEDERRRGEEAARLSEMKSTFLSSMSHELRTPLNSVLGFGELLLSPAVGELGERQRKYVGNIIKAGRHLLAITNDVLDLSKIEAGRMDLHLSVIQLGPLLVEAAEIIEPLARERSHTLSVETCALNVNADRIRLMQVLVNLLSNAIKFSGTGGEIAVRVEPNGPWLAITVADSGPGIPLEQQSKVFERYVQGDGLRADGTGLGLPVSRQLVELMGGRLDIAASSPAGTTFRVRLPVASEALMVDQPGQLVTVAAS